jgi:hypothetical protein
MEGMKQCSCCGETKPVGEFYKDKKRKDGFQIYCKSCLKSKANMYYKNNQDKEKARKKKWTEENPLLNIWFRLKDRAIRKKLDFDLDVSDLTMPEVCPILGLSLEKGEKGKQANSPSVDRIDNTIGYIKGTIQIISDLANSMKRDATPEQLIMFADWIYKTYKK